MEFSSRQLRAFLLVAQHRSFTRAAQALFITPSGLSLLIRELETQLGFRLFDRTTRLVVPTTYGKELLAVAQRGLAEWDDATSRIGGYATRASLSLSLGAAPLIAANVVMPAIREFRADHPNLQIRLFDGTPAETRQRVAAGKLDVGLGVFGPEPGIRWSPFFRFSLIVIRPDKDPAFRPASTTWSALTGEKLICLRSGSPIQRVVDQQLEKSGVVCRRAAFVNLLDTQIAMVEANEGIAIVPSYGIPASRNRRVVMTRLTSPVVHLELCQISNRAKKLPPGTDEFTDFLTSYISRWAGQAGIP